MTESDFERLLERVNRGEPRAMAELVEVVHVELRAMAGGFLKRERAGHTLQPTALVHEAWLKLRRAREPWSGRPHFFAAAANAMRQILVDHARMRAADRRGGGQQPTTLGELIVVQPECDVSVIDLDAALTELGREEARLQSLVELRFFIGMTIDEAAEALEISRATAKRDWAYAKAWLFDYLTRES